MNIYKILNWFTSLLCLYLFYVLLFDATSFFTDIEVDACQAAYILAKRASMMMLGISILLFLSKNLQHSDARQIIIISSAMIMLGFATMGSFELIRGNIGTAIIGAIVIEISIGISYIFVFLQSRKSTRI